MHHSLCLIKLFFFRFISKLEDNYAINIYFEYYNRKRMSECIFNFMSLLINVFYFLIWRWFLIAPLCVLVSIPEKKSRRLQWDGWDNSVTFLVHDMCKLKPEVVIKIISSWWYWKAPISVIVCSSSYTF